MAVGYNAASAGTESVAIGNYSSARGANSVSVGASSAVAKDSVAVGNRAIANGGSSVALGTDSRAEKYTANTVAYLTAVTNNDVTRGVVSVGSTQKNSEFARRIVNVAGGVDNTDAANIGQLKVVDHKITTLEGEVKTISANCAATISQELRTKLESDQAELQTLKQQYALYTLMHKKFRKS